MSAPDAVDRGPVDPDAVALRTWAATALARGRVAWPQVCVSQDELVRIVAGRPPSSPSGALDALDGEELYLAAACARGDTVALHALRSHYFEPAVPALRRMGVTASECDDIWQVLCERLLVSEAGAQPRIVRYAGAGELKGLLRVAATRVALNWREKEGRQVSDDDWLRQLPATGADPELHAMKRQHRVELKQELEAAIAELGARERMVLRLHLVERLGIDAIASMCAVHRATAARMITRAKDRLTAALRARLLCRWNVAHAELPALKTLVDSYLDLSLPRLFAT